MYKWLNPEMTMLAKTEGNHTTIIELGHEDWDTASVRGDIAPYEPAPAPAPSIPSLTTSQLLIGLVAEGWIAAAEGRAWRDRVALPAPLVALIASLPEGQQFAAETRALAFTQAVRSDPMVQALGQAEGKTPEQLDAFFTTYAAI